MLQRTRLSSHQMPCQPRQPHLLQAAQLSLCLPPVMLLMVVCAQAGIQCPSE